MSVVQTHKTSGPPKVLFLSRNYPNQALPLLGLWVQGLVRNCRGLFEPTVVCPVPYCPPIPWIPSDYTRFRSVPRRSRDGVVEIFHPRFLVPPGNRFHGAESVPYFAAVSGLVERLHRRKHFDVIHAHFTYPDGAVGARLAQRLRIPLVITEHARWKPWMDDFPLVRRQAISAVRQSAFHVSVSAALRDEVAGFVGDSARLTVIPGGIDPRVFHPPSRPEPRKRQILFVGLVRQVKGADVLLQALKLLIDRDRPEKLVFVGATAYPAYRREYERLQRMADDLGLARNVEFLEGEPPALVAEHMRRSAVVALPSRRETLGMVLVEALACGTPVVATRCGGPEDIVNERVGLLIPPEDPDALARALIHVMDHADGYDPAELSDYATRRFAWTAIAERQSAIYRRAIGRDPGDPALDEGSMGPDRELLGVGS